MKVQFIGVATIEGITKATKKPFLMHKFTYGVPISPISSANFTKSGFGFYPMEVEIEPSCMNQFALCKLGEVVDIEVQPNPADLTKNIVMGMTGKSPVGAQAKEEKF